MVVKKAMSDTQDTLVLSIYRGCSQNDLPRSAKLASSR